MSLRVIGTVVALGMKLALAMLIVSPAQGTPLAVAPQADGSWKMTWQGVAGRTDFLQFSEDLRFWHFAPLVCHGTGLKSYSMTPLASRCFVRLKQVAGVTSDAETDDYDGDGLTNLQEVLGNTDPTLSDTDGDGLPDKWELDHGLDPRDDGSIDGNHGAAGDPDGDRLTNDWEYHYGTHPQKWDTDGDWMPDDYEIEIDRGLNPLSAVDGLLDADGDGLPNSLEYVFMDQGYDSFVWNSSIGFPWNDDPDGDGLTTAQEWNLHHTNPRQPDTDEDEMDDGWEVQYGFDPLLHHSLTPDPTDDGTADPDGDGLINLEECLYWTNPRVADTDGDGVLDGIEIGQGSNPLKAVSHSAPPNGTVLVSVTFGDHSPSSSEKYEFRFQPVEGDTQVRTRKNRKYGVLQTDVLKLPKGSRYTVSLKHIGTDPKYRGEPKPDYDYTFEIPPLAAEAETIRILKDPAGMLGVHDESETFFAAGKTADLFVMNFRTETEATIPTNRDRKKVGVREKVDVKVTPTSAGVLAWTILNGLDATVSSPSNYTVQFTADTRAKAPTLRAAFDSGDHFNLNWAVVQPREERAKKLSDLTFPAGDQGAGMYIEYTTLPDDVSFENVQMLEVDKGTTNVTGFFAAYGPGPLTHIPNPLWIPLQPKNTWIDKAGFTGWGFPNPWSYGTYQWEIEVRWRTVGESGMGEKLTDRTQLHTIHDGTGKSTESKSGISATRTP